MNKLYFFLLLVANFAFAQPPIADPPPYKLCDNDNNGVEAFDVNTKIPEILNGLSPSLYTTSFYADVAHTTPIVNLTSYVSAGQVIYVQVVENANTSNFSDTTLNLVVSPLPNVIISGTSTICYGQSAVITFSGTPNSTVTYTAGVGPNVTISLNASGSAVIQTPTLTANTVYSLLSVTNPTTSCTKNVAGSAIITVIPLPTAQIITSDQTVCEEMPVTIVFQGGNGVAPFTFTYAIDGSANQMITSDVNGVASFLFPQIPGTHTIALLGVTDSGVIQCFNTSSQVVNISIVPYPIPSTPNDLYMSDSPLDGIADFNLTSNNSVLINNQIGLSVTYYESQVDAELATLSIMNITSYTGTDGQVIWARVQNQAADCYAVKSFTLHVLDAAAIVYIPDVNFKTALINIGIDANSDGNIQVSEALNTTSIGLNNEPLIASMEGILSFTNLINLQLYTLPQLTSLDISNLSNLKSIDFWGLASLTSLNIAGCTSLTNVKFVNVPNVTTLDFSGFIHLTDLFFNGIAYEYATMNLTSLNISGCTALKNLTLALTTLAALDVSSCAALETFKYEDNYVPNLDLSGLVHLQSIYASSNTISNTLQSLNTNGCSALTSINASLNTQLETLYIKNEVNESLNLSGDINLAFICADDSQVAGVQTLLNNLGMTSTVCNSYCSFTPEGEYNTITGNITFDANNNGCDANDAIQPNIRVNLNDGTNEGAGFTDANGNYTFYTQTGNFEITPAIENPTWFTFSPSIAAIPFANNNNTATQNFCIVASGIHPDIEVVIAPVLPARPGFDAVYTIVYKNKGNQTISGLVGFGFDDDKLDFMSSTPTVDQQNLGFLTWNYDNLKPFEHRSITVTIHVHSPSDNLAVNIGDVLSFDAILGPEIDDNSADNTFQYNQTVVGAFDPNNIICLEGDIVAPSTIGNYLHYIINFENTGNFDAENIVVRDNIDTTQYDLSSLQILNSSNPVSTRVKNNVAEFIFQNINLHSGGHGNILLKIKSKNTLVQGDTVSKQADIFFDYNFPVTTDMADTTFQLLSNPDFPTDASISIYPNPTKDNINISSQFNIKSIQLYDIQGRLLQTKLLNDNHVVFDITTQTTGVYFVKITTDKGIKVEKIVKE